MWLLRGLGLWITGHVADAETAWEHAAACAERAGDRIAHADLLGWLASAAFFGPVHVNDGIERCTSIVDQLQDLRSMRAQTLHFLAGLHAMAGHFETADALLEDANDTLGKLSVTVQWAVSHAEVLVALLKGDLERAEGLLRAGRAWLEESGERNLLPVTVALLARALYEQGRLDEALACTEQTRDLAVEQDVVVQAIWRGVEARIRAHQGAAEDAERLAQRRRTSPIARTSRASPAMPCSTWPMSSAGPGSPTRPATPPCKPSVATSAKETTCLLHAPGRCWTRWGATDTIVYRLTQRGRHGRRKIRSGTPLREGRR